MTIKRAIEAMIEMLPTPNIKIKPPQWANNISDDQFMDWVGKVTKVSK